MRTCGGDRAAFEALVRRHRRSVFAQAFHSLRDEAAAEDVTQQVFTGVFLNLNPDMETFGAYLRTCVRNACINFVRARRPCVDIEAAELSTGRTPRDDFEREEARAVLRKVVLKLSNPKMRAVIRLLIDGSTPLEVAEALEVPLPTINFYMHLAKKDLPRLSRFRTMPPLTGQPTTPEDPPKPRGLTYNGVTQSRAKWARQFGISQATLLRRLAAGWELATALETPAVVGRPPRDRS